MGSEVDKTSHRRSVVVLPKAEWSVSFLRNISDAEVMKDENRCVALWFGVVLAFHLNPGWSLPANLACLCSGR